MPHKRQLRAVSAWQLEFVRLIAFPTSPPVFLEQEWWKGLVTERPDDFVSTRKKGFRDDRGRFEDALLSVTVDSRTISWEARPPEVVDWSGILPTFDGPFQEKFDWFVKLLDPWLKRSSPPIVRISFSAKLLQPAATATEAYRVLATHLPTVDLASTPNDFLVLINRRKKTSKTVKGLPINRVCTWSKMNAPFPIEPGKARKWPDRCYSVLEFDINTAPERTEVLPGNSLSRLFRELMGIGIDVAEHGDQV